jgi:hypothetical protein
MRLPLVVFVVDALKVSPEMSIRGFVFHNQAGVQRR